MRFSQLLKLDYLHYTFGHFATRSREYCTREIRQFLEKTLKLATGRTVYNCEFFVIQDSLRHVRKGVLLEYDIGFTLELYKCDIYRGSINF